MDEIIERLKFIPVSKRIAVAAIIGLVVPWFFVFMDEIDSAEYELETATSEYEAIEAKFNRAKSQKNDMPELEKKLDFTRKQLAEAKTRLPDDYEMNSILEFVANSSDEAGVELLEFTPNEEAFKNTGYSYVEMPIALSVQGTYNQTGVFFDKLIHMEKMVHIRDITSVKVLKEMGEPLTVDMELSKQAKLSQELEKIRVKTTAKMIVFRSARPGESAGNADAE
jgi:Tfp pilus assembly protein PilO